MINSKTCFMLLAVSAVRTAILCIVAVHVLSHLCERINTGLHVNVVYPPCVPTDTKQDSFSLQLRRRLLSRRGR